MKDKKYRKEELANLRSLKSDELSKKISETEDQLFWLKFKNRSGQLEKPLEIRKMKVELARMKTLFTEMQVGK